MNLKKSARVIAFYLATYVGLSGIAAVDYLARHRYWLERNVKNEIVLRAKFTT